jgi:hypothetical protein
LVPSQVYISSSAIPWTDFERQESLRSRIVKLRIGMYTDLL